MEDKEGFCEDCEKEQVEAAKAEAELESETPTVVKRVRAKPKSILRSLKERVKVG